MVTASQVGWTCSICGGVMMELAKGDNCPHCSAPPRTRTLPVVLGTLVAPRLPDGLTDQKPLLAFAMTATERKWLSSIFPTITSVSLFGNYGAGHIPGVDVRDLGRFAEGSFSGVFSILLFDYFVETEKALAECARVLAPGGVLFTHLARGRLVDGEKEPVSRGAIAKSPTYFSYLPDAAELANISIGRSTFVRMAQKHGIDTRHHSIWDESTGQCLDWFVGFKKTPIASHASNTKHNVSAPSVSAEKLIATPLKQFAGANFGRKYPPFQFRARLSIPMVPVDLKSTKFAEHVMATQHVHLVGRGVVGQSTDNGETWNAIALPESEGRLLDNCFTTADGSHLVQCRSKEQLPIAPRNSEASRASILLFDHRWKLVSVCDQPEARWHGRASIDEAGGTIMFAEYHDNTAKYAKGTSGDPTLWKPLTKVNRVFRSRDGGRSWQIVFEAPLELIRHFHTLQADRFVAKSWWLSSGDRAEESHLWHSSDDGDTWTCVTNPDPEVQLPPSSANRKQSVYRFTDMVIERDHFIWGCDDLLGVVSESDPSIAQSARAGSRIYRVSKTNPMRFEELGFVGNPVRSIVDIGAAFLFLTEAKGVYGAMRPQCVALFKDDMSNVVQLAEMDNFAIGGTGFTFSVASKSAIDGRFFCYRQRTDVFDNRGPSILQWDVELK